MKHTTAILNFQATQKLQEERTIRKICSIDSHISLAFAGLTADARVMIDRVRTECQQHRLTVEDAVTVEYITCFLGQFSFSSILTCQRPTVSIDTIYDFPCASSLNPEDIVTYLHQVGRVWD